MHQDSLTVIRLRVALDRVIARLACCWIENHSELYTAMDAPKSKWSRALKRVLAPIGSDKPVQPDKFFGPIHGGNLATWLLFGQTIGPYWHDFWEGGLEISSLAEYWQLWVLGLELSDYYRQLEGAHYPRLPYLWTLEAPPPHFF